jgi:hypothetical protein
MVENLMRRAVSRVPQLPCSVTKIISDIILSLNVFGIFPIKLMLARQRSEPVIGLMLAVGCLTSSSNVHSTDEYQLPSKAVRPLKRNAV